MQHYPDALLICALHVEEHVAHIAGYKNHRGQSHEPTDSLTPFREHVVVHGKRNHLYGTEEENTSNDQRGKENPAEFPPKARSVSYHLLNVIIELIHT